MLTIPGPQLTAGHALLGVTMLLLTLTVIISTLEGVLGKLQELRGEECEDGYIDCSAQAELCNSSHIPSVLHMLTHCRQTCRQSFTDRQIVIMTSFILISNS